MTLAPTGWRNRWGRVAPCWIPARTGAPFAAVDPSRRGLRGCGPGRRPGSHRSRRAVAARQPALEACAVSPRPGPLRRLGDDGARSDANAVAGCRQIDGRLGSARSRRQRRGSRGVAECGHGRRRVVRRLGGGAGGVWWSETASDRCRRRFSDPGETPVARLCSPSRWGWIAGGQHLGGPRRRSGMVLFDRRPLLGLLRARRPAGVRQTRLLTHVCFT